MLDGNKHCYNGDEFFICHMPLLDHLIEESCDFMSYSFSFYVTTLPSLVIIGNVIVEINIFSVFSKTHDMSCSHRRTYTKFLNMGTIICQCVP